MFFLQTLNLYKFPELVHGFATRVGADQYALLADKAGATQMKFVTLKQIHSGRVVVLSTPPCRGDACVAPTEGDALVTNQPGILLGIRTADCVPLLVYDFRKKIVAAIHAGWRGLVAGVIENTFDEMKKRGSFTEDCVVAIGASLCASCFEVGPEVTEAFENKFKARISIARTASGKAHLDLRKACQLVLKDLGVPPQAIQQLEQCTRCNPELFFSYRAGDIEGRMVSFIGLKDPLLN